MIKPLAILTEFVCVLMEGGSVFLFTKRPIAEPKDIIQLRETYHYLNEPFKTNVELQADHWFSDEEDIYRDWRYANTMPIEYSKRSVIIADITEMTSEEINECYGKIVVYNRRYWSAVHVVKSKNIWFRPNIIEKIPEGTYVKHELRLLGNQYSE